MTYLYLLDFINKLLENLCLFSIIDGFYANQLSIIHAAYIDQKS